MVKLASVVVHTQELLESIRVHDGVAMQFDERALYGLTEDREVFEFIKGLDPALLPVKR
jgi:hypothetical protein